MFEWTPANIHNETLWPSSGENHSYAGPFEM